MDEPTTALDVVMQRQIVEQIVELRERLGFSVIFITHDVSLLIEIADRIAIMYARRDRRGGRRRSDVYRRPRHPYSDGAAALVPAPARAAPRADRHPRLAAGPVEACPPAARSATAARSRSTPARRSPRARRARRARATTPAGRSRACGTTPRRSPRPGSSRSPCPWSCRSADPRPAPLPLHRAARRAALASRHDAR